MDKIKSAETEIKSADIADYEAYFGSLQRKALIFGAVTNRQVDDKVITIARINHNRWIAHCPLCAGAEYVWLEHPMFYCQSCWNKTIGGKGIQVILPDKLFREEIEKALLKRPDEANRNWIEGETIKDLQDENRKAGIK